jgi:hypothetical protein
MSPEDLKNRFEYHQPPSPQVAQAHQTVRESCFALADELNDLLPEGREKSLAVTNLEQVMMWANAAIARHGLRKESLAADPIDPTQHLAGTTDPRGGAAG